MSSELCLDRDLLGEGLGRRKMSFDGVVLSREVRVTRCLLDAHYCPVDGMTGIYNCTDISCFACMFEHCFNISPDRCSREDSRDGVLARRKV